MTFKSDAQRKAVMSKFPSYKVHYTDKIARIRVRKPSEFIKVSFKTHDIGRKGHTKRIAGILKNKKKWATQAILIPKKEFVKGNKKAEEIIKNIK